MAVLGLCVQLRPPTSVTLYSRVPPVLAPGLTLHSPALSHLSPLALSPGLPGAVSEAYEELKTVKCPDSVDTLSAPSEASRVHLFSLALEDVRYFCRLGSLFYTTLVLKSMFVLPCVLFVFLPPGSSL